MASFITITQTVSYEGITKKLERSAKDALDKALDELLDWLRSNSPRSSGLFASSWDVKYSRKVRSQPFAAGSITNTAPDARFRLFGRGSGGYPFTTALEQWCNLNGLPFFPVAVAIAKRGTQRNRDVRSVAGFTLDQSGTPTFDLQGEGALIFNETLERELSQLIL